MNTPASPPPEATTPPWRPGALLTLHTPRFTLRSLTREDVDDTLLDWLADTEVMAGLGLPRRRLSRTEGVAWVLTADHRRLFRLGIAPRPDAPLIGFYTVDVQADQGWAETSVVVGERSWWGRDVVRETRARLLDFLFDDLGMHRVIGRPHGRNLASIFNYKALGFRCEGILREHLPAPGGSGRHDQFIFGLLRSEWQARRQSAA